MIDFQDIIDMLLQKRAEVQTEREALDAREAKINDLLTSAGYVEPVETEETDEEITEVEDAEEQAVNESIYEPTSSWTLP